MISVHAWLEASDIDVRLIMQVHDELVFEVASGQLDAARQKIVTLMESAAELSVPLLVDVGTGTNWDEAH